MTQEDILRMAREAGFEVGEREHGQSVFNPHTVDECCLNAELERFFKLAYESGAAAEREAISDEYAARLQGDLENGVRRLNEAAASEFHKKYPQLASFNEWLNERGNI